MRQRKHQHPGEAALNLVSLNTPLRTDVQPKAGDCEGPLWGGLYWTNLLLVFGVTGWRLPTKFWERAFLARFRSRGVQAARAGELNLDVQLRHMHLQRWASRVPGLTCAHIQLRVPVSEYGVSMTSHDG